MSRGWKIGAGLWTAFVVAMIWTTPRPPEPEAFAPQELEINQRTVDWAVRDAVAWRKEEGDQTVPWERASGHLAIVIDDVGRELRFQDQLQSLRFPLTYAIVPGGAYATGAAERLGQDRRRHREVWLHLPMEALDPAAMQEGDELRENFLMRGDSPAQLAAKTNEALARVPAAVGVNNHMGSALTADAPSMDAVMSVLAQRELLFLDSRTNPDTVARRRACAAGVPALRRHVFLDHDKSPQAVQDKLDEAIERSKREPTIVIGHPGPQVVAALRQGLPDAYREGVGVYPLSEFYRHARTDCSDE